MLGRARSAGIDRMIVPGIDAGSSEGAVRLAASCEGVYAAAGIHPSEAVGIDPAGVADAMMKRIARLAFAPRVCAVGETGLDFAKLDPGTRPAQEALFLRHLDLAAALDLTLIVHSRGAESRILDLLPREAPVPVVLHCYTGGSAEALEACRRGYFVSFAGALARRSNSGLRRTAAGLPPEALLVETDSPFMTPPGAGAGRNEPANAGLVAEALALARGVPLQELAPLLSSNCDRAFRLGAARKPSLVYLIDRRAYVNLTGRCCNDCGFCIRKRREGVAGYLLAGLQDPPEAHYISRLSLLDPSEFDELVFCGFGEPTLRPAELVSIAGRARQAGWRTRLDTNGQSLAWMSRDAVAGMLGRFDSASVSLNAPDGPSYDRLCSPSAPGAWENLLEFLALLQELAVPARLTAVDADGVDIPAARELARSLGLPFAVRSLN